MSPNSLVATVLCTNYRSQRQILLQQRGLLLHHHQGEEQGQWSRRDRMQRGLEPTLCRKAVVRLSRQVRIIGGAFFPQGADAFRPSMSAEKRFGVTSDKAMVGPGPAQSTTTVDTQPTTTIPLTSSAAFTGIAHGSSFFGWFGKPLQDVGHRSEQIVHVRKVCPPFSPALVATS